MGRRLALLIATYAHEDAGLRQLTAPAHDAEALGETLRDPDIAGFEVTTLVNQPHYEVGRAIGELCRDRRRDDLVLLYFTGHGLKDDAGRLHLAMTNTRRDNLAFTSLPAELVDRALADCMSRRQVLILDCCYGGAFPAAGGLTKSDGETHALERFGGRGRTVLTAADASQFSFESDGALRGGTARSVFTHHLVNGLRDGTADLDGDGDITLDELYAYVHEKVVDEMPQQRPKKQADVEGQIVIARNVHWTLPAHLANSLDSPIATDRLGAVDALARLLRIGNPLVRERATAELERLADDDSRRVSAAASEVLRTQIREPRDAEPPDTEVPYVAEEGPEPAEPSVETPAPVTASVTEPTPEQPAVVPEQPAPAASAGWTTRVDGAVRAPLIVADGVLYVCGDGGSDSGGHHLYTFDAATGEQRWRLTTDQPVRSTPVVAGGLVFAATVGGQLHAVDTLSGTVMWTYTNANRQKAAAAVAARGPWVYFVGGFYLRCFYVTDPHERWHRGVGMSDLQWVAVTADQVWCGNTGRNAYATDAVTGRKGPRLALRNSWSSPQAVTEDGLGIHIVGEHDGAVYRFEAGTGTQVWRCATLGPVRSSPVVADGRVYAGDGDGNLYAIDEATGALRWCVSAGTALNASPAVADGILYIGGMDGKLFAFDAATGVGIDHLPTGNAIQATPAVAGGLVYFGTDGGTVHAIRAIVNGSGSGRAAAV
ncbi:caspase, EACC1-associated type [Actinacidiphila alni]|uniref:caspase, EACC1-associated type n=1 Tax=Actinacidiphila alni TaxID=380248 RepID=UPI0034511DB1